MKKKITTLFLFTILFNNLLFSQVWEHVETFSNMTFDPSYYKTGGGVGDNNIKWNYKIAKASGDFSINGNGIMLRGEYCSYVFSQIINGGVKNMQISLKKGFANDSIRKIDLYINEKYIKSASFNNNDVETFYIDNINIAGDFTIRLFNSSDYQVVIDDISWNSYSVSNVQSINNFQALAVGNSANITWLNTNNDSVIIACHNINYFTNPVNGQTYNVGSSFSGGSKVVYIGTSNSYTHAELQDSTMYIYKIWTIKNKEYSDPLMNFIITPENKEIYNYTETFSKASLSSGYTDGNYIGDNNVKWNFVKTKNEDYYAINGKGAILKGDLGSYISTDMIGNGISNFKIYLRKAFTGNGSRQVEVFVNEESKGMSPLFDDTLVHIFKIDSINAKGGVNLRIQNASIKQVVIDNIKWSNYVISSIDNKTDVITNNNNGFEFYPNPVKDILNYSIANDENGIFVIEIFKSSGEKVKENYINKYTFLQAGNINITAIAKGIYFIKVSYPKNPQLNSISKLIIE
ncbi:MAG: hypothetical protein A2X12_00570 [Bacteroidetes bacterium GWE2_29_8]|nr:MAG: hypothetical protein A2X12_00570 [Bacteroidetes bacterium GWE2_29_8]OFY17714.1 MAG: hypothetical protein A2X02_03660 [Bacteroidetes bacterium GWF2_29_10]